MSDDERSDAGLTDDDTDSDGETGSKTDIPISTGGDGDPKSGDGDELDGDESSNDGKLSDDEPDDGESTSNGEPTANGNDTSTDDGIEIDVGTGSPGLDAKRRSNRDGGSDASEDRGFDLGDSEDDLFDRLDESVLVVLSRVLDTETHLRVYVALRERPWSTAAAIADETGLYPRAVEDAMEVLRSYGAVERRGPPGDADEPSNVEAADDDRDAGDDHDRGREYEPEYAAVAPSVLLADAISASRGERGATGLPGGLDLDRFLGSGSSDSSAPSDSPDCSDPSSTTTSGGNPVRIDVDGVDEHDDADERNGANGDGRGSTNAGGRNDTNSADDASSEGGTGDESGTKGGDGTDGADRDDGDGDDDEERSAY
jgi:hypothetical protein